MAEGSLLNAKRPPMFCPGCSHDLVVRVLDRILARIGVDADEICLVSDIGCSGFFDVFFRAHAFHGLHGRSLTYAAGIKMCRPELTVVVTMGDGGLGIGAAHLVAACRRNLDLTLLVLNNFNFGMTGGQCSATTPTDAVSHSGFLNRLERPLDLGSLAVAAGAPWVCRCSAYQEDLTDILEQAIRFKGFSVVEIRGLCPGRYTKLNRVTPKTIAEELEAQGVLCGPIPGLQRDEFGDAYRREAASQPVFPRPTGVEARFVPPQASRREIVILGNAGQHVVTAGEVLAMAALSAGLHATQKNEYDVTVLRGPSISEVIIAPDPIDYHACEKPSVIVALADEGVKNRKGLFAQLSQDALVLQASGVEIPPTAAVVRSVDFRTMGLKHAEWALFSLALLAEMNRVVSKDMLRAGIQLRFHGEVPESVRKILQLNA
ncbi:MAG: thiamine pyrophosphate-dependent enzyme [Thermodesulfobacteriota bacterium]